MGRSDREPARLSLAEGAPLSLMGGLAGAVVGPAAVLPLGAGLLGGRLPAFTGAALLATAVGVVLVCAALVVPIRARARIAPVQVLAEECADAGARVRPEARGSRAAAGGVYAPAGGEPRRVVLPRP